MTPLKEPFALTREERNSPLWQRLMGHFADRVQALRQLNDATDLGEQRTAAIRGEIAALKRLQALNADRPSTEPNQ